MTYQETIEYIYNQTPQFQRIGAAAYKPGLNTVVRLAELFGNPHKGNYRMIHVAGTNGKGSTSHSIAACLQRAGYKVGLFTSPHLIDFRERIRVNGQIIPEAEVIEFIRIYRNKNIGKKGELLEPSFFQLTTVMGFWWFAKSGVDVAVIEVGLGGRLDSTNIIDADLNIITNISFDHTAQLGKTLREIAGEKAGVMRPGRTTICGEPTQEVIGYLSGEAVKGGAQITFCQKDSSLGIMKLENGVIKLLQSPFGDIEYSLSGNYQQENILTVIASLRQLRKLGYNLPDDAVKEGLANVEKLTGLMGRWMKIGERPLVMCDTGHNIGGWSHLSSQLAKCPRPLRMVIGFVNDKDVRAILELMPKDAVYYFTQASVPRAMSSEELATFAKDYNLHGEVFLNVREAFDAAKSASHDEGTIFVGGSTFVVADFLMAYNDAIAHHEKNL